MSNQSWNQTAFTLQAAGPTLTAAAAASMLVAASPLAGQNRWTIPAGTLKYGDCLRFKAYGIHSVVVTTPGTLRFDLRFGSTVIFDSGAITLETANALTNTPWMLEVDLTIRSIGATTAGTLWAQGKIFTGALVAAPLASAGSVGVALLPWNAVPAISTGFDTTVSNVFDSFFTQTVATGSLTCEGAELTLLT
jgi:hypothetical protein